MVWISVVLVSLIAWSIRPILPIDETRYLAVAYEMFTKKEWVVPYLNGEIYSQKPPVLFWLIQSGWHLFGINTWWPRLLGLIALLMNGYILQKISKMIFPGDLYVSKMSSWIYITSFFPLVFSSLIFFDIWLSLWVSCAWLFILKRAINEDSAKNLIAFSFFLALGFLTKGPVILIFILPALCFKGLFSPTHIGLWAVKGIAFAFILSLIWIIPAFIHAGESFNLNLLVKCTCPDLSGRLFS